MRSMCTRFSFIQYYEKHPHPLRIWHAKSRVSDRFSLYVTVQYLHSHDEKIHENRLRRWDFFTPESYSYGLRGSAPTCSEQLPLYNVYYAREYACVLRLCTYDAE